MQYQNYAKPQLDMYSSADDNNSFLMNGSTIHAVKKTNMGQKMNLPRLLTGKSETCLLT